MKTHKKQIAVILIVIFGIILGIIFIVRIMTPEDTWICSEGKWIKHGNPSLSQPKNDCK